MNVSIARSPQPEILREYPMQSMSSFAPAGDISRTMQGAGETWPGVTIFAVMWALRRGWCFFCSTAVIIGSSLRRALHLYKSRIEIALTDCLKLYGSKVAVERRPLSAL